MFESMSAKDRRAITLGLTVLAPALFFVWGVKPYFAALTEARAELATERDNLARERAAIAAAKRNPQLQQRADSAMRAVTPRLFAGRDEVMAGAELTSYLGDVAHANRVWLQDAATRPAVLAPSGVRSLRVEIRGESDLRGILALLHALETGPKLIRVDRLDISRAARATADDATETLALSATVVGFSIDNSPGGAAVAPRSAASTAVRPLDGPGGAP